MKDHRGEVDKRVLWGIFFLIVALAGGFAYYYYRMPGGPGSGVPAPGQGQDQISFRRKAVIPKALAERVPKAMPKYFASFGESQRFIAAEENMFLEKKDFPPTSRLVYWARGDVRTLRSHIMEALRGFGWEVNFSDNETKSVVKGTLGGVQFVRIELQPNETGTLIAVYYATNQ